MYGTCLYEERRVRDLVKAKVCYPWSVAACGALRLLPRTRRANCFEAGKGKPRALFHLISRFSPASLTREEV
jgi:hypothetical protein